MADSAVYFGTPKHLIVSTTSGIVEMEALNGPDEKLQLWTDVDAVVPDRVTQSMWVSLCREALIHRVELMVVTEDVNSAQVVSIRMSPGPAGG